MDNKILTFKHTCFSGDLIYAMAGIKAICENNDHKAEIYQWLNQEARLYDGANHPYEGKMMNDYAFKMMKPLIESQSYVRSFNEWSGEKVHINMDQLRQVKNHMPYGNIVTWMAMVFAEMRPEYWKPWLEVPYEDEWSEKIVVNRTTRYHNQFIDYFCLKEYEDKILFVGTRDEHERFQIDWKMKVEYKHVGNFYHLAVLINSCKVFIGNQSMCFAIAEALKVPRLLEICDFAPNVQPCGDGGYYFRVPELLKYQLDKIMK
jgi:hypothetical protein